MRRIPFTRGWETRPHANFFAEMVGAAAPWQRVTLPHDAALDRDRDASEGAGAGYIPGGVYEYRTTLAAPEEYRDMRVLLEFEGVYRSAMVYVNGALAGQWATGYTGFTVDLDDHLLFGVDNEIRVVCRAYKDSRWYSGAGIHRPVHLVVSELLHIVLDGVRVTTTAVDDEFASIEVATTVEHHGRGMATLDVATEIRDGDGAVVAVATSPVTVLPGEPAVVRQRVLIPEPALWSTESPSLYSATVVLRVGDSAIDDDTVTFGVRTLSLDPERGLRINGVPVKLRGACVHSDNGVLGAAAIGRAEERRVQLLKEAGFNALRSAHNPMSRAMLDACDRFGILVMDELTDIWTESKSDFDAALDFPEWWERDVEAMVRKDVNHPSVILYSIGNEIPEVAKPHGAVWSRRLAEKVRSLDGTRFVTNGVNAMLAVIGEARAEEEQAGINTMLTDMGAFMDELSSSDLVATRTAESYDLLDAAGMNYMEARYELDRVLFPRRVIVGSETFPGKIDRLWRLVLDNPHVIGDFTWTGWDYLGEAGVGRVTVADDPTAGQFGAPYPWLLAHVGDIDITGHRRPQSYYREIVFGLRSDPYIAVLRPELHGRELSATPWAWSDTVGSWSWADAEGKPVTVEVYSDADEVELLLDGASLGIAPVGEKNRFRAEFEMTYTPGELVAVARTGGEETGLFALRSATGPVVLAAAVDRPVVHADDDLAYVEITLQDAEGTVFAGLDRQVTVSIEGPGVVQGFGSAAPCTEESFLDDVHTTFDGRVLAVIRPTGPGTITVTASAPRCDQVTVAVEAR
jgi:beta-galactosidase